MRLHRFFITSNINKGIINSFSSEGLAHQLKSVFRFHEGSKLVFFDGSGTDYVSELVSLRKGSVEFRVLEEHPVKPFSDLKLSLAFSLIKKDNIEWIIEKGTELGVSRFIPLVSERSEKKGFNMERAKKIAIEACEQSGRSEIPEITLPHGLAEYMNGRDFAGKDAVVFHPEGSDFKKDAFAKGEEIIAFVGPEGGWSPDEIALFKEKGATIVKLNAPVLRAETAAIAVSAILLS